MRRLPTSTSAATFDTGDAPPVASAAGKSVGRTLMTTMGVFTFTWAMTLPAHMGRR